MTLTDCDSAAHPLGVAVVKNTPWQMRLKAAGLTQKRLAEILGVAENTVSRQAKGDWEMPGYVEALVTAWEIMSPDQRAALIKRRERKRPDGGKS